MDFYERFGKLLSEKLDSSADTTEKCDESEESVLDKNVNENGVSKNAAETEKPNEKKAKTFGDVSSAAFLFNKSKERPAVGEIVKDYTEDAPVKIINDAEIIIGNNGRS